MENEKKYILTKQTNEDDMKYFHVHIDKYQDPNFNIEEYLDNYVKENKEKLEAFLNSETTK